MPLSSSALVSLPDLKQYLGTTVRTDDAILEACIERASGAVERYCARKFGQTRYWEWHDGNEAGRLRLRQAPTIVVRAVLTGSQSLMTVRSTLSSDAFSSVSVREDRLVLNRMSSTGASTTTEIMFTQYETVAEVAAQANAVTGFAASSLLDAPARHLRRFAGRELRNSTAYLEGPTDSLVDYVVDVDTGVLFGSFPSGDQTILVDYTAGYERIPDDVKQATLMVAANYYRDRQRDMGIQSESLGGYSYSRRSADETRAAMADILVGWRTIR